MRRRWTVDVIVPVRDGCEHVAECLQSIRRHGDGFRLILVDDGTSRPDLRALLQPLAEGQASRVVLLRNERPLGFAASINRGIDVARNDLVLLDPGSIVTGEWLERLRQCASSDPAIGMITTLSNVEIGGGIDDGRGNDFPVDEIERLGLAVPAAAVPLYPDLPVATGGCVFIHRRVVRKLGALDERLADRDAAMREYGTRASNAGFRIVLCDDVIVFCRRREQDAEDDPASSRPAVMGPICGMIRSQVAVDSRSGKLGVLHVLHGRGGGTEKHVQELIATPQAGFRHYVLRIMPDRWRLIDVNVATPVNYDCDRHHAGAARGWLGTICNWLHVDAIHVHSLVGTGDDLPELLGETGLPYAYSVHDMYPACPTVYLIGSDGQYCNATTDLQTCRQCLSGFDAYRDTDLRAWRSRYQHFLEGASAVFAPSEWARDTLAAYYPGIRITIAPHAVPVDKPMGMRPAPNAWRLPEDSRRHVGMLGAIGPEKGARQVEAMAARIRERGLPLRLVVVGYTDCDNRSQSDDNVLTVHGRYEVDEIATLFDHYRIALVAFPTVWPETFSYTLGESWRAGRPALVPPRGALLERVRATGAGWIMDGWPDVDAILDQIVALTDPGNREELARRGELARRASSDNGDATDPVRSFYHAIQAAAIGRQQPSVVRWRVYEAACLALGVDPVQPPPTRANPRLVPGRAMSAGLLRYFRR